MRRAQAVFERFYMVVTANRKLRWAHALGTVVVVGNGWSGTHGPIEMVRRVCFCCRLIIINIYFELWSYFYIFWLVLFVVLVDPPVSHTLSHTLSLSPSRSCRSSNVPFSFA